jgi:hypothetical protein
VSMPTPNVAVEEGLDPLEALTAIIVGAACGWIGLAVRSRPAGTHARRSAGVSWPSR